MASEISKRDANRQTVILLATNDSNLDRTMARSDPTTKRLLVNSTITGNVTIITGITSIVDGRKVVTTAGTRETLVGSSTACKRVIIMAETDNTGQIVVGGSTVVATLASRQGITLNAGDAIDFEIDDLQDIYIDSTVNGEGVTFTYFN